MVLGRVEPKDILTLARARVDGPDMLASLHFPNGRNDSVFFDGVIRNLFGAGCRRILVGGRRWFGDRGFVLRHFFDNTPLQN